MSWKEKLFVSFMLLLASVPVVFFPLYMLVFREWHAEQDRERQRPAREAGYKAGYIGAPPEACPHEAWEVNYQVWKQAWIEGFQAKQQESKR